MTSHEFGEGNVTCLHGFSDAASSSVHYSNGQFVNNYYYRFKSVGSHLCVCVSFLGAAGSLKDDWRAFTFHSALTLPLVSLF